MENIKKLVFYLYSKTVTKEDLSIYRKPVDSFEPIEYPVGIDIGGSVHRNEAVIIGGNLSEFLTNDVLFYGTSADERPTCEEVLRQYIEFENQGLQKDELHTAMMNHYTGKTKIKQES